MRSKPFSRLIASTVALLLIAGCATSPRTAQPAPGPTEPPEIVAPTTAPEAYPAAQSAYPVPADQSAYPAPDPANLAAQSAYPEPATSSTTLPGQQAGPLTLSYRLVNTYPHDPEAFTQGLVYVGNDTLYEGTGLKGQSTLREVDLTTGEVRTLHELPDDIFGEGVAVLGERIFQLTWQDCVGFIYTHEEGAFQEIGQFRMPVAAIADRPICMEGWGLTSDGERLILSDGTANLYFVDPEATASNGALTITGQVEVRDSIGPVINLNELEYINGAVYANIWFQDRIARIDPATGQVTAYLDLSDLRGSIAPEHVLNGIAYDEAGDRIFVTGKNWPSLFEIELVDEVSWTVYLPVAEAA